MTTPPTPATWTSVRVTKPVHERLERVRSALQPGAKMNDAVSILMDPGVVRVVLTPNQRARWERAAEHAGVDLSTFIQMRVEAALQYGCDPTSMATLQDQITRLGQAAGTDAAPRPRKPEIQR